MPDWISAPFHALACALLALVAVRCPPGWLRRALGAATVAFALGLASLDVASGGAGMAAPLPDGFLPVTAALMVLGPGLTTLLMLRSWGRLKPFPMVPLVALVVAISAALPVVRAGGWWPPVVGGLGLAVAGATAGWVATRLHLSAAAHWLDLHLLVRGASATPASAPAGHALLVVEGASAALALLTWNIDLLLAAVIAGTVAGHLARRSAGAGRRLSLGVLLSLASVGTAWWLFSTVAGAERAHTFAALGDGPFSPAFEYLAALLLVLGAWPLLRLFPMHGAATGALSPILGLALLGRFGAGLLPSGVAHWLPLVAGLAALAAWHAAAVGSAAEAFLAVVVLAALVPGGGAGWAVLALGAGTAIGGGFAWGAMQGWHRVQGARGLVLAAGCALLPSVLAVALRGETLFTVLAAGGLAATIVPRATSD